MFENIGKKIKGLAKVICWIGIIFGALISIIMIIGGIIASVESEEPFMLVGIVIVAILYFALIFILCWISSWTFYGYGELIDKINDIDKRLASGVINVKVVEPVNASNTTVADTTLVESPSPEARQKYKCPTCNADVYMGDEVCPNCKQKFNWENI